MNKKHYEYWHTEIHISRLTKLELHFCRAASTNRPFLDSDSFYNCIPHFSCECSSCNNNLLILDVKQLNKIMKLYYFYSLKAL